MSDHFIKVHVCVTAFWVCCKCCTGTCPYYIRNNLTVSHVTAAWGAKFSTSHFWFWFLNMFKNCWLTDDGVLGSELYQGLRNAVFFLFFFILKYQTHVVPWTTNLCVINIEIGAHSAGQSMWWDQITTGTFFLHYVLFKNNENKSWLEEGGYLLQHFELIISSPTTLILNELFPSPVAYLTTYIHW